MEYQLDMLIDCDKRQIRMGFVKQWSGQQRLEIVHDDIPEWRWLPHFNVYDGNAWLRILSIHPSLYRKHSEHADKLLT